jgi:hypothetical protein
MCPSPVAVGPGSARQDGVREVDEKIDVDRLDRPGRAMDSIAETIDNPVRAAPPKHAHRKWSDFVP